MLIVCAKRSSSVLCVNNDKPLTLACTVFLSHSWAVLHEEDHDAA